MWKFETVAYDQGARYVVGCDEAGRGCLAGPVVAASVYIPVEHIVHLAGITDSKQLTDRRRRQYFDVILTYAKATIGVKNAAIIDEINIYEASRAAMLQALDNMSTQITYDYVLTDAMPLPSITHMPVNYIIKGDQQSLSIAAASIIAKVCRDNIMIAYGDRFPLYHFQAHKGYGTKKHLEALEQHGAIEGVHRMTYKPLHRFQ